MNRLSQIVALASVAVLVVSPAMGAPAKKPAKSAATRKAPVRVVEPPVEPALPVRAPGEVMIAPAITLRLPTVSETEANAMWNLRAALNIAALQCQFSPFLATVSIYNAVLRQHSAELDRARTVMIAHFRRLDGKAAQNSFDQYTTRTYNSFSTLDAQLGFCEKSAMVGREALTVRQGQLAPFATRINPEIRASLVPVPTLMLLGPVDASPVELPPV